MLTESTASARMVPEERRKHLALAAWQETFLRLLAGMERRDPFLRRHADRVGNLCTRMGSRMGFSGEPLFYLQMAAFLHDIGKLGVPASILDKPTRLSHQEYRVVKHHAIQGAEILKSLSLPEPVCRSVRSHHERFNGQGYPDGLARERIPLEARILGVVDAFDAMTEHRPYRFAMSSEEASQWLSIRAGMLFDPDVVACFLSLLKN